MSDYTIYHNPRCSKSRATLQLLNDAGVDVAIVKYLEQPPSEDELKNIASALGQPIRSMLRTGEADYKTAGLADDSLSEAQLLSLIHQYPKVLERPIVVKGQQAIIGRPPENVMALLP
jgi:arsenate reductase